MVRRFSLFPVLLLLLALCPVGGALAHPLSGLDLEKVPRDVIVWEYLKLGFQHILPLGIDHILFVLSLVLPAPRLRPVLLQATAFTIAHSLTLGLAMYGFVNPPPAVVEPLIALSIAFVALENLLSPTLRPARLGVVFAFGLVHGLGFAGALGELGLPRKTFLEALLAFNGGVELGQVTVILLAWVLIGRWAADRPWYRQRVVVPASVAIALVALWWTVERTFLTT